MNSLDKNDPERNKKTQAFDPSLVSDESPAPGGDAKRIPKEPEESEENKEKTEVITKEAFMRISSGSI